MDTWNTGRRLPRKDTAGKIEWAAQMGSHPTALLPVFHLLIFRLNWHCKGNKTCRRRGKEDRKAYTCFFLRMSSLFRNPIVV
jgi:hypothetical protein